jgi:hypothetical protein
VIAIVRPVRPRKLLRIMFPSSIQRERALQEFLRPLRCLWRPTPLPRINSTALNFRAPPGSRRRHCSRDLGLPPRGCDEHRLMPVRSCRPFRAWGSAVPTSRAPTARSLICNTAWAAAACNAAGGRERASLLWEGEPMASKSAHDVGRHVVIVGGDVHDRVRI